MEHGRRDVRWRTDGGDGALRFSPPEYITSRPLCRSHAPISPWAPAAAAAGGACPSAGRGARAHRRLSLGTHRAMTAVSTPPNPPRQARQAQCGASCLVWLWGGDGSTRGAETGGRSTRKKEGHSAAGQQSWRLGGVGRHLHGKCMQRGAVLEARARGTAIRLTPPCSGLGISGPH